jgi:aromatic ring hydroxylase
VRRSGEKPTPTWLEAVTGRSVLVHTKDDRTIEGVIVLEAEDGIVLRGCKLHGQGAPVGMAGDVYVPAANVTLVQLPA